MTDKIRIKKFILNNRNQFTKWGDAAAEKNLHNSMEANNLLVRFCDAVVSFIDSLQEEPVSEDLENAGKEWLRPQLDKYYKPYGEGKMMELTRFDGYAMLDAIEFGAKWQKQQDQSIIELAEDHAMLAGMEKMKEQMMEKAVETTFNVSLPSGLYDKLWIKGCKEGDKLLVIKK